jgi:hypothetical protein
MSGFEFNDPLNWNLVTRIDLEAVKVSSDPDVYGRIPARTVLVEKRILMIGCRSRVARSSWWLGCRASKRLLISPSSTSDFPAAVYTEQVACPLNTLTLVKFDAEGPYPCLLVLDIPRWLTHLYVEVWAYDGPDDLVSPLQPG